MPRKPDVGPFPPAIDKLRDRMCNFVRVSRGSSFRKGDDGMIRRFRTSMTLLALLTALGLGPVTAQDNNRPPEPWIIKKTQLNATECTCRAQGQSLPVGSEICMGNGMFRCQMDQNVTSWKSLASPCPTS